jgi:hypothetical protein
MEVSFIGFRDMMLEIGCQVLTLGDNKLTLGDTHRHLAIRPTP